MCHGPLSIAAQRDGEAARRLAMVQPLHKGLSMKIQKCVFVIASSLALITLGANLRSVARAADASGSISGQVTASSPKQRANVVVYLDKVAGSFRPPARPVVMDQKGMKFAPHVLAVQKGQTVLFNNHDNLRHNIFTPDGDKFNLGTWGQGESKPHTFTATGTIRLLCNVHPEMGGVIMVLDNPFFAVTGDDGKFEIPNVPPGKYTLKTWGEKLPETTKEVTVAAGPPTTVALKVGR
jgi:plastocyanin